MKIRHKIIEKNRFPIEQLILTGLYIMIIYMIGDIKNIHTNSYYIGIISMSAFCLIMIPTWNDLKKIKKVEHIIKQK